MYSMYVGMGVCTVWVYVCLGVCMHTVYVYVCVPVDNIQFSHFLSVCVLVGCLGFLAILCTDDVKSMSSSVSLSLEEQ